MNKQAKSSQVKQTNKNNKKNETSHKVYNANELR